MKQIIKLNFIGEVGLINSLLLFFIAQEPTGDKNLSVIAALFSTIIWVSTTFFSKNYYNLSSTGILSNIKTVTSVLFLYFLVFYSFINLTFPLQLSNNLLLHYFGTLLVLLIAWRIIVFFVIAKRLMKLPKYQKRIIIVGQDSNSLSFYRLIEKHPEYGYKIDGIFSSDLSPLKGLKNLGTEHDVIDYASKHKIDEIICSLEAIKKQLADELVTYAQNAYISIKFFPDLSDKKGYNYDLSFLEVTPLLSIVQSPLDHLNNQYIKRGFDIVFSFSIIVFILSWITPIIGIISKLTSKGPIFFTQKRSGIHNSTFTCFKFRTMRVHDVIEDPLTPPLENYVTPFGAILRKLSIDELPQFVNVLMGSMSVVGPRPHMVSHTAAYADKVDKFMTRHIIKPGITGLSQVLGYRGATKELYMMRNRVRLDRFYIDNWSFYLDMKIIYFTIISLFRNDQNAY